MEPHKDDISEHKVTSPVISKTETLKTDRQKAEIAPKTSQSMATPSYVPVGYPDFGNLWTSEPKPLPGPEDHPFFKWIAEGAIKDPAVYSTNASSSKEAGAPSTTLSANFQHRSLAILQPQPIYPYVPIPTLEMEPITPELTQKSPFAPESPSATPDLSSSPTEPSPFSNLATPAKTNSGKSIIPSADDMSDKPHDRPSKAGHEGSVPASPNNDPDCTSTYKRPLSNVDSAGNRDSSEPLAVLNGQIWRSGSQWRRHQWSTDNGEGT